MNKYQSLSSKIILPKQYGTLASQQFLELRQKKFYLIMSNKVKATINFAIQYNNTVELKERERLEICNSFIRKLKIL